MEKSDAIGEKGKKNVEKRATEKRQIAPNTREKTINSKLEQAHQYFNSMQFSQASQLYQQIIEEKPELRRSISINLAHSLILEANWHQVSSNLIQGINYLSTSGWLNSLFQGKPLNAENKPIPWYTYPAIEFLEDKIKPDYTVFEFGGGNSTLWWANQVKQVISIESDQGWFNQIYQQMPNNVQLNLETDEKKYADFITQYTDQYFDIIIVDGINRNNCLSKSLNKLKNTGLLIFDNTDHHSYDSSLQLLSSEGYKRIDFYGLIPSYTHKNCTSVFFKSTEILEINSLPSDKKSCLGKSCMQITSPKSSNIHNYQDKDNWQLNTPVAFLIFNRPDTTQQVFEAIRQAKPPKLLVVADGARVDKEGEAEKCEQTRAIINQVDWECEVLTNYSEVNLGCRKRVSSGLNWVFEQVEEAIILEDDCLPHPTFFRYCQELLEKYREDERIMMISGDNFQFGRKRTEYSYYFSRYGHVWGWASWRRAWTKYDDSMAQWEELRDNSWLKDFLENDQAVAYWAKVFQSVYEGFYTWDYIWVFTMWANNGLAILPNVNLVSNIGFGSGTHTTNANSPLANIPTRNINFPLLHPNIIERNIEADNFTEYQIYSKSVMVESYKIGDHNIYLPDNHKLEQYQQTWKLYDRMLGIITRHILAKYPQTTAIDVGANVGDTAALIQEFQTVPTLCIEGNPEYLPYLEKNAKIIGNIEIARCFLGKDGETVDLNNISSQGGTTSILNAIGSNSENASIMQSLASLLKRFSNFQNSKILKIDTDGFDFEIIVNSKDVIKKLKPIIYFEYDISFNINNHSISKALNTINFLTDLGYEKFMLFDNFGNHLCSLSSNEKNQFFDLTNYLFSNRYKSGQPAVYYFDICAFHYEDIDVFGNVYNNIHQGILGEISSYSLPLLDNYSAKKDTLHNKNKNHQNTFISYAQNFEDVLLNRVFKYKTKGFYIDIGALHPTFDSVTKAFYDRGWSGINIEPIKDYYNVFEKERNRDINLNIAVSDSSSKLEFFQVVGQPANSTLNKEIAYQLAEEKGLEVSQYPVSVKTLREICQEYVNQKIDFLKIDVEGLEEQVILGGDWESFRPTILVIETTLPNTNIRCDNNIARILKEKGYQQVFFDGINDYYISEESKELAKHFEYPVNILDFYLDYRLVKKNQQIDYLTKILQDNNININPSPINPQNINNQPIDIPEPKKPIILIDSLFFQMYNTGIARVWKSLLKEWANTEFAHHILVLDRANTAPKINGIRYLTIPSYNYKTTERDRQMLQQICDQEGAELFISTYYSTPITTPSVFMGYDMIPEVLKIMKIDPKMWEEKHRAIKHASSYIAISENTAKDINKIFPEIPFSSITVAYCGIDTIFCPANINEINVFKKKYGIKKPYFLLGNLVSVYKNPLLFFQAFNQLSNKESFDIIATGKGSQLPSQWREYISGCTFQSLLLNDEELRLAYSGAIALVYPSKYEGFGMPVAEAMACGCPVITTRNASLPEVAGNAGLYIRDDSVEEMANALCEIQKPSLRHDLINKGLQQAQKFSWKTMADVVKEALFNTILPPLQLTDINYLIFPDWQAQEENLTEELSNLIQKLIVNECEELVTLVIDTTGITEENANLILSGIVMNLMFETELDLENILDFALIRDLNKQQWDNLVPKITAKINLVNENKEAITQAQAEEIVNLNSNGNNYVIFPDWETNEAELSIAIREVLISIANHPEAEKITLLVDISKAESEEEVALFFSGLAMNLILEEGIELPETTKINFVNFTAIQWNSLVGLIEGKFALSCEYLWDNLPQWPNAK